jgi:hypothetical protein
MSTNPRSSPPPIFPTHRRSIPACASLEAAHDPGTPASPIRLSGETAAQPANKAAVAKPRQPHREIFRTGMHSPLGP